MKNPFGRKARLHLSLALIAVVVITHSGCTTDDKLRRMYLPSPPSEDLRSQLGRVRLSEGGMQTVVLFTAPAKGAGAGMARGAGLGPLYTIVGGGAVGGGYGVIAGIFLAPVGALVGAVVGAASAEPATKVEEKEAAFRVAMEELKVRSRRPFAAVSPTGFPNERPRQAVVCRPTSPRRRFSKSSSNRSDLTVGG